MTTHDPAAKPVLVSGVQANGDLHLGNLIGAIDQWVKLLDSHDSFVFLADLHALTTPQSGPPLREVTRQAAALYVAAGLDPARCHIYRQSDLAPYHTELTWYLTCVTPVGQLQRMTQFKSKSDQQKAEVGAGLLTYPILQAADIALYDAEVVPVGHDQLQHLELTRDIVEMFNRRFGGGKGDGDGILVMPEAKLPSVGARVLGLDDPTRKMSKSLAKVHSGHAVFLLDEPKVARKKIMRAVTDSGNDLDYATASPGVKNLIEIGAAVSSLEDPAQFVKAHDVQSYGQLKSAVADAVVERLAPIQAAYHELMADPTAVDDILAAGAAAAAPIAERTIARVRAAQGF
ncbi:MAG TPA: tryptophan--tRNA ligase [Acidimicrobiales bacterium]